MWSANPSGSGRVRTLRGVAVFAATVFAIWPFTDNTSARLVSVQALPEAGICAWEPDGAGIPSDLGVTPDQLVSLARERSQQASLFAALRQGLQQRNLFAAVQRGAGNRHPRARRVRSGARSAP